MNININVNKH